MKINTAIEYMQQHERQIKNEPELLQSLLAHPRIKWSDYRDRQTKGQTVVEALKAATEEIQNSFITALTIVLAKLSRHQRIDVSWWYKPFIYIDVMDTRWKHYPCGHRMLVSFDVSNGKLSSPESENSYAFARKGWRPTAHKLTGYAVLKFTDCGNPDKHERC